MNTSDDIILLDSDGEFKESHPAQKHASRATRQRKSHTKQNKTSSKRGKKSAIIIDEDDISVIPADFVSPSSADNVTEGSATDNTSVVNSPQSTDVNTLTENSVPEVTQPRRAAKRGLAKHKHNLPASESSLPHRAAVYSQTVLGFKSLLYGPDTAVDDSNTQVTSLAVANGTSSELPDQTVSSGRAGSESKLSSCSHENLVEEAADTSLITSLHIQSPSPPPQPLDKRALRMNKKLTRALRTLNKAKISLNKITPPRKQSDRRDSDVIIVGEEDGIQKTTVVKVRYLTKVYRIKMQLNEPFHVLTSKLSQEIDEAEHSLGLFLHDRSLEVTETPLSVNLTVADIIECHCIKVSEESVSAADAIELVIQCRNSKSRITIAANKRRPLSDVIQKYAQLVNAEAGSFVFSFDGEDIEPTDTPSKLDMEDHDVIDVVYD